jgi:hypothetical protein
MKSWAVRTLLVASLLFGIACSEAETNSAAPEPTASKPESPEPSPSETGNALPEGVSPTSEGILQPGSYQTSTFEPVASFEVGRGWRVPFEGTDYIVIARKLEPRDEVIYLDSSQQSLDVNGALRYVQDAFIGSTGVAGDFRFFNKQPARIGELAGTQVSMEVQANQSVVTLALGIEAYEVRPGDRIDINAIDVGGKTILVFVEAPGARFAAFDKGAQRVIASLRFEPGA